MTTEPLMFKPFPGATPARSKDDGGFFDLPESNACVHPGHGFPQMLHVPPGKGYTHICPGCGAKSTVVNHGYRFNADL